MSAPAADLRKLLSPTSIAVIGASPDPGRHNGRTIANLERTGFAGAVYPVNPRHDAIGGWRCYDSVSQVEEPIDLAYVLVRAELVESAVRECVEARVAFVVVCSSGFAEEGDAGSAAQRRLTDMVAGTSTRLIGPNCIGVISVPENVCSCTTLNVTTAFRSGGLAIVSQSGGMATNVFNRAQGSGVGVRALVSLGNEADLDLAEVVQALSDDPLTTTVFCYIEQLRDSERFAAAAEMARLAGKTVVVMKVGSSEAGARSALSHTGSLAGSDRVFRAMMRHRGVAVVTSLDEVLDVVRLIDAGKGQLGQRLLVVSPSGGECGYVADAASALGLELPDLSPNLRTALSAVMRFGHPTNPLDLTGQVIGSDLLFGQVLGIVAASCEFDTVLVALPTWGEYDSRRLTPGILAAARDTPMTVLITAWSAAHLTEYRDELLRDSDVATFDDADSLLRAMVTLRTAQSAPRPPQLPARNSSVIPPATALVSEDGAKAFLATEGLSTAEEVVCKTTDELADAAAGLGWPVVVKGIAPGVAHKSDLGLVVVGIDDFTSLDKAVDRIKCQAKTYELLLHGFLVARQYSGLELIVGGIIDETFGPVVIVGPGGVLAELMQGSTAFLPAPVDAAAVRSALLELPLGTVLEGYRGVEHDLDGFVQLVCDFADLFSRMDGVEQIDLNPVIVGARPGAGAHIVDALFVAAESFPHPQTSLDVSCGALERPST